MLSRRLLVAGGLSVPVAASAQSSWPTRPIRVVLPGPAGGVIDVAARAISEAMLADLGQPLVIDPRPGGNGVVAGSLVSGSPPDGHTLLMTVTGHVALPFLMKVPFDVMADFTPVAMVGVSSAIVCVHPSVPVKSLDDLVAHARSKPGKVNYLNPGNGTGGHLIPEQLKIAHGIEMTSISYRGLPPGILDLLGGRIELGVVSSSLILHHVKAGSVRAIAIVGRDRIADIPDIATMAQQGFGSMEVRSGLPIYGPKNLPATIVARLNLAVARALAEPEVQRRLATAHIDASPMTPGMLETELRREHQQLGKLIGDLGIKADGG